MYYLTGTVLIVLSLFLLLWAVMDIKKNRKGFSIILLLLLLPIIGPILYFQFK
jgi:hypothetical protein